MINTLLIGSDRSVFEGLETVFKDNKVNIAWSESGTKALEMISGNSFQMVITDEDLSDMTGLQLIRKLVEINPMINCAAISSLPVDEYHEQSEGLGILMQLPAHPTRKDGQELFKQLDRILNLSKNIKKQREN